MLLAVQGMFKSQYARAVPPHPTNNALINAIRFADTFLPESFKAFLIASVIRDDTDAPIVKININKLTVLIRSPYHIYF